MIFMMIIAMVIMMIMAMMAVTPGLVFSCHLMLEPAVAPKPDIAHLGRFS